MVTDIVAHGDRVSGHKGLYFKKDRIKGYPQEKRIIRISSRDQGRRALFLVFMVPLISWNLQK